MTPVFLSKDCSSSHTVYIDWGGGGTPYHGIYTNREASSERCTFFRLFGYSEREGISLVEVYKRLGNSNLLFHSVRGLERACKGKKLIEMILFAAGERGAYKRG